MTISVGETIPQATLYEMTDSGPGQVSSTDVLGQGKVAFFAVPGAFTPTCHMKHLPSFVGGAGALKDKGVDSIVCISVNDPFVMKAWGETSGAAGAGIRMVADADGALTKAMGLDFDASAAGLGVRARRFSAYAEDGVLKVLNVEESPGQADATLAEKLVEQI